MRNTVNITGVPVDKITMKEAVEKVKSFLSDEHAHSIYTPNAEFMMTAHRNPAFREILCHADMCIADGAGVVLASKILGRPVPEKVSGVDLVKNILLLGSEKKDGKLKFYFLGSKPGVAEEAAANVTRDYPGVEVAGCRHGYFSPEEEESIVNEINKCSPDILLVALSQVKQEKFIHNHKSKLKAKVCIGVGGTLDILSGKAELAPDFFRRNGLEWLFRLYKEPKRFKRMLDLPKYILLVFAVRLKIIKKL